MAPHPLFPFPEGLELTSVSESAEAVLVSRCFLCAQNLYREASRAD